VIFIQPTFPQSTCVLSALTHQLHLKRFFFLKKNLILKQVLWRRKICINLKEKYEPCC
jgi:hypothetical protein